MGQLLTLPTIHISELVDVKFKAIFEIKQPGEEVDTGFVEKIPQLVKFMEVDDMNKIKVVYSDMHNLTTLAVTMYRFSHG